MVWAGGGKRASVFHGLSMPYPRAERGPKGGAHIHGQEVSLGGTVRERDCVTRHEKRLGWRFAGYAAPAPRSPSPETPLKLARKWLRNGVCGCSGGFLLVAVRVALWAT